ncbi:phosphatase PAP2 family protein [Salinactinospora qingdaonensis]
MREIAWGMASDRVAILLAAALAAMTMLSAGPLQPIDEFANTLPRPFEDELRTFLILWPDTVASRFVALPVLGVVAFHLAYWHYTWRPIVLGICGVTGMIGLVATMKLVLARSHPRTGDPSFLSHGSGISFPSGHGANAILIYGLVLFLIYRYAAARPHIIRNLGYCVVALAALQTVVSIYLHFHWLTDLLTGMVAGGFALRLTIRLDELIPQGRTAHWWPFNRHPETHAPIFTPR